MVFYRRDKSRKNKYNPNKHNCVKYTVALKINKLKLNFIRVKLVEDGGWEFLSKILKLIILTIILKLNYYDDYQYTNKGRFQVGG